MGLTRSNASWRNGREPAAQAGRHGDVVVEPAAESLAQGSGWAARVHAYSIWRTLHEAGLSWQKSRTWCETGIAMRKRKHGVMHVSDPDAAVKRG